MNKSRYRISKMDCPSEEQMIRMKLAGMDSVRELRFDLQKRELEVFHSGSHQQIFQSLESLDLGTSLIASGEEELSPPSSGGNHQRRLLWQVLGINLLFFILEMVTGIVASSLGLVADSLDMLADSLVYGLALAAVGAGGIWQRRVAKISGYFQLLLAFAGLAEVGRRFLGISEIPDYTLMMLISLMALGGNTLSLYILRKDQSREAHMQASMIFTSNDILANLGVMVAGALVFATGSKIPDLVIGLAVFLLVGRGALKIMKLSE